MDSEEELGLQRVMEKATALLLALALMSGTVVGPVEGRSEDSADRLASPIESQRRYCWCPGCCLEGHLAGVRNFDLHHLVVVTNECLLEKMNLNSIPPDRLQDRLAR